MSEIKKKKNSMTEGPIFKSILLFSLPLIAGNFLQQLYNTFDSVIVGNVVGEAALAAVGATSMIVSLLLAIYQGASTGAGILIARYYGGGKEHRADLNLAVRVTILLGFILAMIITVLGIALSPLFLEWMHTPDEIMADSLLYIRIFFAGMLGNVLYNMGAGILNAVGNSTRSLLYLAIASILNIILDIILVWGLQMGVAGAAIATIISQAVSAILILHYLWTTTHTYGLRKMDGAEETFSKIKTMARRILTVGLPSAIQSGVIIFSNVLIQAGVNSYGTSAIAGFTAYLKIDGFNILPVFSFSLAATTFVSQNIGAGKLDRVKKGTRTVVAMGVVYALIMGALMTLFPMQILSIFTRDTTALEYGVLCAYSLAPVYFLLSMIHSYAGAIRGSGKTLPPTVIILISLCGIRLLWIWFVVPHFDGIMVVYLTYTVSIVIGAVIMTCYARFAKWIPREVS